MYKVKRGDVKSMAIRYLFVELDLQHGRITRALTRDDLAVPQTRTLYGERSISVFGSRIWNLIPPDIRICGTFDTFCKHYWCNTPGDT